MFRVSGITIILLVVLCVGVHADELKTFTNVTYVDKPSNDGDSFTVKMGGKEQVVRLYFVDCPETTASSDADARRVREQMRYFGLPGAKETVELGKKAGEFTKKALAKPFTVYTSFAAAGGRTAGGRVYGFVSTSAGNDLASVLTAGGFARVRGVGRRTPGGVSREETVQRLRDVEMAASMKRCGIWEKSDPDRIVALRAEQRREEQELAKLKKEVKSQGSSPEKPLQIDVNKASKEELQLIKGIGPVLAGRIIEARPFKSVDELVKVKGIGEKSLGKMKHEMIIK